jgi:WXG100 family type VII secretion target
MKTAGTIKMEFQAMFQRANKLEELALELKRHAREIEAQQGNISSVWTGEASEEFQKKLQREKDLVYRHAGQLEQAACAIRRAAIRIYNTEKFALSLIGQH